MLLTLATRALLAPALAVNAIDPSIANDDFLVKRVKKVGI